MEVEQELKFLGGVLAELREAFAQRPPDRGGPFPLTAFAPSPARAGDLTGMLDELIAWGAAPRTLRHPAPSGATTV